MDTRSPPETSPWLPFESRRRARDEKREAVLRTAVQLFLEQGYHRATLNDVAERLNITKPALYNYFRGKDEILFECWALGQEQVDEFIAEIRSGGGNGLDKLRRLARAYGEVMATEFGASLVRFDPREMKPEHAKQVRAAKKGIDLTFRNFIKEGIADGALSGTAVAEEFAIRLTEGLAQSPVKQQKRTRKAPAKRKSSGGRRA